MSEAGEKPRNVPKKRAYSAPKLETFGTIRDITRGAGNNQTFDGGHPPGQNKSQF